MPLPWSLSSLNTQDFEALRCSSSPLCGLFLLPVSDSTVRIFARTILCYRALARPPTILTQSKHCISCRGVSHEMPDIRRCTATFIYGGGRPRAILLVLITSQPKQALLHHGVCSRHPSLLQ